MRSISDPLVRESERMLTGGFYAEIDPTIAQEKSGRPVSGERGSADPAFDPRHLDQISEDRTRLSTEQFGKISCCAALGSPGSAAYPRPLALPLNQWFRNMEVNRVRQSCQARERIIGF
jgi:hypothetical protein